jgi:uncharacterized protein (TIGR02646 family)
MIRITKSQPAPTPLTTRGARHLSKLQATQAADPAACQVPGNKLLESRDGIYNDAQVKAQLLSDQHRKCCYCESRPTSVSYGDVEHFRPKGGYQQVRGGPLHKPGYYWLAYAWDNLYFACHLCNQEFKRNYFPLRNPTKRARCHIDPLAQEQPLLIDPATEDPARYLTFRQDAIAPKRASRRGQACIEAFGLDRPELISRRIEHLKRLTHARIIGGLDLSLPLSATASQFLQEARLSLAEGQALVVDARRIWQEAALDAAEFAGMVRANFPHLPTV